MYGIAMTVAACLQAGTRADVAWLVATDGILVDDWSDAVVFTPGGGRTGAVLGGALDAKLGDLAGRWPQGRIVDLEIAEVDALISELPSAGSARFVIAPAETLPAETWAIAAAREPFCIVLDLDGDEVTNANVYSNQTIPAAGSDVQERFERGAGSAVADERIISVFGAVPQMIIVGATPIGEALAEVASIVGWQPRIVNEAGQATGLIAPLSTRDKVVVAAHDLELAGAALTAALESESGYIGSLGSRKMQQDRADWLAYRGVTDLDRVHGPAGLDIGADNPREIAVAIVAEAIASHSAAASPAR